MTVDSLHTYYDVIRVLLTNVMKQDQETVFGLSEDDDLRNYDFSSLAAVELVVALELKFNILIEEEDMLIENLCTLNQIATLVRRLEEEQA
ncbi:acyl carrier protein [Paenibacillus plantarum]|nr:acyl carrier protein [Paenibacillus plantarum]